MTPDTEKVAIVQDYRPLGALVPEHWTTRTVNAKDGTPLHITQTGNASKPLILLLHGYMVGGLTWLRIARALETDYAVTMLDFRGHGRSGGPEKGFSLDVLAENAATVLHELKLEGVTVIGHSMGGDVAARLAITEAESIRALIMMDPPMRPFNIPFDEEAPWQKAWLAGMRTLKGITHDELMVEGLKHLPPGVQLWGEVDYVPFMDALARFDLDTVRYSANMDYQTGSPEFIAQIDCPLMLITGNSERGGSGDPEHIAALSAVWRQGQSIHFDDAGHFIQMEQFDRTIQAITQFLKDVEQ